MKKGTGTFSNDENEPVPFSPVPFSTLADAVRAGLPPGQIARAAAEALGVPFMESLAGCAPSAEFLARIPIAFARQHRAIGLAGEDGGIRVVLGDPCGWRVLAAVAGVLGKDVEPALAEGEVVLSAVNAAYQQQTGRAEQVIEELDRSEVLRQVETMALSEDLLDVSARAPVIKLVNLVLLEAVKRRASDVHVHPYEDRLVFRFRIDGVLYDFFCPPKALQEEIVGRIKVMGGMNIAEKRLAQDGRATVQVGERLVDLRIATLPTCFGERTVLRLLDKGLRMYRLGELGMDGPSLAAFREQIAADHGIILVTGPTGSGKTTTLYAALREIDAKRSNVLTLEDPIEYRLEGISQTQVSEKKGMTFAGGLRHVLRQDPDIIMVGEIRDAETARMAIQSALTGHLVFSTLHTNDAASAVTRLLDLGVEPYLAASSLVAVMAQRLVRRVCDGCARPVEIPPGETARWGLNCRLPIVNCQLNGNDKDGEESSLPAVLRRGVGCDRCLQTGYYDRVGIFELLTVDEPIREAVLRRAPAGEIKQLARAGGMRTLREDGLAKALTGRTTLEEVVRVTVRSES